ncbi:LOW QUALITY PROTEIN: protein ITPRID2 [Acanthochromis polyacanthus]|uniref:LOW QUALITY PROTEIN: protein ITPRID2 n=1 Tax=Acanthochromis polyacanthus TaxID=80966 RepID=UPI0022345442|nr:LOW QUALITY PROTEIN: protein ITPRID2 [Acanthochromis polyacanthus]
METGALGMETSAATDPRLESMSTACVRRRAWAQSKDSVWQESKPGDCGPQGPQQTQTNGNTQRPSEEPGQVPNKITNWLSECRTPLGASLDDQSASPSKGALRNGCSFEDDLSLGAEANHLQSSNNKTESCFGLAADQKRSQYKERGRSMNSTGSGKSSTVSSVSELLDLYEEDPEEILLNLGFGREEPDLSSKIPSRFFNSTSSARGIDIKVYLGAQLQRMELENPNYALTSRFRQIEVLTTVANEFFQLYSQVSGQPVQRISSKDLGGDGGEGGGAGSASEQTPPQKKSRSAVNVAKQLLKKSISKHNLLAASPESPEGQMSNQQLNGHATASDHTHTNGHAYAGTDQDGCSATSGHQVETVIQKHTRKKDNCSLATVTEETNGDGESDRLTDNSPDQSSTRPEPDSADLQSTNQRTEEEGGQEVKEENNLTSTPDKAPASLTPPQLAQLRSENADSFDMEEIQSNEDESQSRTSRATDLLRTVSQQSDSSGFAEEPSADSNTNLKVQDSSDSCDSETTVTSHPSQDVATPLAMDQPAFDLPDGREEGAGPVAAVEADRSCISREEDAAGSPEPVPQYTAHHLPRSQPMGAQQEETQDEEEVKFSDRTDPEPEQETTQSISTVESEPLPQLENVQNVFVSEQEPQPAQAAADTGPPTEGAESVEVQAEAPFSDDSASLRPPAPSSPLQSALNRAKQQQLNRVGSQSNTTSQTSAGRRSFIPLQRSSSLPSSILAPSRVVPSVRIQFGRGQTSYYTPPKQPTRDTREEEQEEEEEGQTNYLSTVTINPGSSSGSNKNPLPATPPKPFPRHLMRSSYSLQSSSPPPDWSPGGHAQSWSTQSVPDLSSNRRPPTHFPANQHQQSWNPGQMTFPNPLAQCSDCSPSPFTVNPPPQSPSPLHPYASLPNLHHYHHHSSLTSLHQPNTPPVPPHGSMSNFHHPSTSTAPHLVSLGHFPPGSPTMHQQGYNHPYNHQLPYNAAQHGSPFASPYLGYHGYSMNPHMPFPHPVSQYSPLVHEHSLYPGLAPSAPGFLHPRLGVPAANLSSTEMQLRKVLHEIRGTVQSLAQNRADTPGAFSDHSAALPSNQSLTEFQQKRRNLNLFRSQMMDLELSILQQQAVVYKHLSPADRLELEQLQSLRSAVREELQELEQQLEDRLLELTHNSQHRGLHVDRSVDSLSTASALRAMEPMSDLLREQLFLQSEISYGGHAPSTGLSSRASSPDGGGEGEQRGGVYKASINITPTLRPGPSKHTEEEEEEEEEENKEEVERDRGAAAEEGGGRGGESPEEEGAAGVRVDNLQQLISEIRKSVAQEVRREIYSELLAAVSPQRSPVPSQQQPL